VEQFKKKKLAGVNVSFLQNALQSSLLIHLSVCPSDAIVPRFNSPAEPASAFSMAEPVLPVN